MGRGRRGEGVWSNWRNKYGTKLLYKLVCAFFCIQDKFYTLEWFSTLGIHVAMFCFRSEFVRMLHVS